MIVVVGGAVGVVLAGPLGGLIGCLAPIAHHRWSRRPEPDPEPSLVIMLILIELRSGMSILAALESASHSLPRDQSLRAVARVARVSGLLAALPYADTRLHPVVSQLARAQRSGASLTNTMRQLLESNLAAEKTNSGDSGADTAGALDAPGDAPDAAGARALPLRPVVAGDVLRPHRGPLLTSALPPAPVGHRIGRSVDDTNLEQDRLPPGV